jgi:hypothetical protein
VWSTKKGTKKLKRLANKQYVKHHLYVEGRLINKLVHVLIAETFIDNPHEYPEVNHKNGDKHDCSVSNLEWTTRKKNMEHAANELKRWRTAKYVFLARELVEDGWTYREIGAVVGRSAASVYTAVKRVQTQ